MGTWYFFFHVFNRHEQVLWKTSMTFETCLLFMLYVDYGFNNNKHTLYCPKVLGRPLLMNRFDYFSNFYEYKS